MKKILVLLLSVLPFMCQAALRLPALVCDNMVLQQNTDVRVWGWSEPRAEVSCTPDWQDKVLKTTTDRNGYWEFIVQTLAVDHKPHSLTIEDGRESKTVQNILFGEVWFGGGQSNMEMPVNGFWGCPIKGSNREIAESGKYNEIRCFMVKKHVATDYQDLFEGTWECASPETTVWWSATGWYFAKHLYNTLHVPVGMLICSWGGTRAESWMPKDDLKQWKDVDYSFIDKFDGTVETANWLSPYLMYYGMFKPVSKYTVKGILFYQGCSNVGLHETYASKMQKMVERWRSDFKLGEIPFYYVEVAPYNYGGPKNGRGTDGSLLREAQFKAQELISNSQMICINDLVQPYELDNIHPSDKDHVGERLAWCALNRDYGYKDICCTYPTYKSMEINDGKVTLHFDNAENSLCQSGVIQGFEIAGEDKVFHPVQPSEVQVKTTEIVITSSAVPQPAAVRYCFHDFEIGTLTNHRLMPVIPFRTDNW